MDRGDIFLHPVTLDEAPDYYDVIKEPMCWTQIDTKLKAVSYLNVADFKVSYEVPITANSQRDIYLVLDNAMQYNKSETTFHRVASRIKKNAKPLLDELDSIPATGQLMPPEVPEGQESWAQPPEGEVGDLETSLARLQTMLAPDPTDSSRDILRSIFAFEVEKEPPPPPSPKKRKSMTAAERNKKFEEAEERYKGRLSMGGGSTRVSRAAAAVTGLGPQSEMPPEPARSRKSKTPSADAESERSRPARTQPGVVGVQSVPAMSHRERVKAEKSLDLIAESLDSKDEYERFNVGWILPEGSKRRRPAPTPSITIPPKRASSRGASSATSASEARSKRRRTSTPAEAPASKKRKGKADTPVKGEEKVDGSENEDEELTPVPDSAVTPTFPRSSLSPPPGDVDDAASDKTAVEPTRSGNAVKKAGTAEAMDVDPSDTKDVAQRSSADPETQDRKKGSVPSKRSPPSDGSDPYPAGTQVWAKVTSYPYFPGVVVDPRADPAIVPEAVLALEEEENKNAKAWLVRFYDKQGSWGWMHAERLERLGQDKDVDAMYLAGKERARNRGFKSSHLKASCRAAYQKAMAAAEGEGAEKSVAENAKGADDKEAKS